MHDTQPIQPRPEGDLQRQKFWQRLGRVKRELVLGLMFALVTALYAVLMFTDRVPLLGLVGLGVLWLVYALFSGRLTDPTPLDLPILALLAILPISLAVSLEPKQSLPQINGLILSVAAFYVVVNGVGYFKALKWAIFALVSLAIGTAILGWFGTDWSRGWSSVTASLAAFTQPLLDLLPRAVSLAGIHVNTLGGALAFFIPTLVALLWDGGAYKRTYKKSQSGARWKMTGYKILILIALVITFVTLVLTRSRGALLGSLVGLLVYAIWKDQRFLNAIPLVMMVLLGVLYTATDGTVQGLLNLLDTSGEQTFGIRLTLMSNTVAIIQDFPLTGVGMGNFGTIYQDYYSYSVFPHGYTFFSHPHNTLLAIAVEQGIPALVLYTGLLSSGVMMVVLAIQKVHSIGKTLLMGLTCGMLAHQVYGVMDAYVLGKKLGVILWLFLGLMTALFVHRWNFARSRRSRSRTSEQGQWDWQRLGQRLGGLLVGLGLWAGLSLAAVGLVNLNPYLSLGVAVGGGILLGGVQVKRFRQSIV